MKKIVLLLVLVQPVFLFLSCKPLGPMGPLPVPPPIPTDSWTPTPSVTSTPPATSTPSATGTPTNWIVVYGTTTPWVWPTMNATKTPVVPPGSGCVTVTMDNTLSAITYPQMPGAPITWSGFAPPSLGSQVTLIQSAADWAGYIAGSLDPTATPTMPFDPATQTLIILNVTAGTCQNPYWFSSVCNTGTQLQVNISYSVPACCIPGMYGPVYYNAQGLVIEKTALPIVIQTGYAPPNYPTCAWDFRGQKNTRPRPNGPRRGWVKTGRVRTQRPA